MVMRLDGVVAFSSVLDQQHSFASSYWFVSTLRNETFTVTGDVALPASEHPTLFASLPLHTGEGKVVGVVALTLRPAWLRDVLRLENGQPLANTSVALLDRRGSVMAESAAGAAIGEWMPGTFVIGARLSGKRSEEHTSALQSLMRISYAVFCLKKKTIDT